VAAHDDLISGFVHQEREMSGERNSVNVRNQDGERICPHESEDGGAIFLTVKFGYVHFLISGVARSL
jgi:hypothetical protein